MPKPNIVLGAGSLFFGPQGTGHEIKLAQTPGLSLSIATTRVEVYDADESVEALLLDESTRIDRSLSFLVRDITDAAIDLFTGQTRRGSLRFIADNTSGANRNLFIPLADIKAEGQWALKGRSEPQALGMRAMCLDSDGAAQLYFDGVPVGLAVLDEGGADATYGTGTELDGGNAASTYGDPAVDAGHANSY